jgi:steroid delta-isomerase-like uncharacterized protein
MTPEALIRAYYEAFNRADWPGMLGLLTDDVAHDVNQGDRETGIAAFRVFLERMAVSYRERITDLIVLTEPEGNRAGAEFVVHGTYLATDPGLPPARRQTYILPAGAFFEIRAGRIARVSNFYNLEAWLNQVR